ncbi:hypothetical protein NSMM_400021 [Nitrosomonas mobilis]|uniref:Uncharacterized protein n=1 Tax=Nitrosomonas mobilis TaxID=51642 RepID=A0A1G5SEC4_9PROT|nr:hypothetical protein NSMM_400021 [Nitrosomonas mobilis]
MLTDICGDRCTIRNTERQTEANIEASVGSIGNSYEQCVWLKRLMDYTR